MTQILTKSGHLIRQTSRMVLLLSAILWWGTGVRAQVTGTKVIGVDYPTLLDAILALNAQGVGAGGATINIPAGYTETAPIGVTTYASGLTNGYELGSSTLYATLSAANPLVFQKSGAGANPVLTAYTIGAMTAASTTSVDGIWRFVGTDYVTVDGIDLAENAANTTAATMMEYGYGMFKESATNGTNNNVIKNCTITLNRNNITAYVAAGPFAAAVGGSIGIAMLACTPTAMNAVITQTSTNGASSNNQFYSNTIQNVSFGIALSGAPIAAPYALADLNNDIGGTAAATGNIIRNFGGGLTPATACGAVFVKDQWTFNVSYNTVNNFDGTANGGGTPAIHAASNRGIWLYVGSLGASANINNNNVTIQAGGAAAVNNWCIDVENGQSITPGNTINVNNNTVSATMSLATNSGQFSAIWIASMANTVNVTNNTISNYTYAGTGITTVITNMATGINTLNITNNFLNNATYSSTTGTIYGIHSQGGVTTALNITGNEINGVSFTFAGIISRVYRSINISLATATAAYTINNNKFQNFSYASGTPATVTNSEVSLIYALGTPASYTINGNNVVGGLNIAGGTTGALNLIYNSQSAPNVTVSNNDFSNITRTGTSASAMYGYYNFGFPPNGTAVISGNTFNNISLSTTSTFSGLTGGFVGIMYGTNNPQIIKIMNNTVTNLTNTGTGSLTGIAHGYGAVGGEVSGNTVSGLNGGGIVTGIQTGSGTPTEVRMFNNNVNSLSAAGTLTAGIVSTAGVDNRIFKNKIFNLNNSNAAGISVGLRVSGGTTAGIYNNLIGDIKAAASAGANQVIGLDLTGGTAVAAGYNTVNLNAGSSGLNFGSSAVNVTATPANVTLLNNIFINNSTPAGTGLTVAYRRASTNLLTYTPASNNNIFYAGTPSATRLIFTDGTNLDQQHISYKLRVTPADALSGSENTTFLSTLGSSANFLHLDNAVPTWAESGASPITTPVAVTDDYDGNARNVTTPDMGADETNAVANPTLAAPINFGSNSATTSSFNITWDDNSNGEIGFLIYRSLSATGPFVLVAGVPSTSSVTTGTSYSLAQTGLLGNTTYYFQIAATNATISPFLTGNAATTACGGGLSGVISVGPTAPAAPLGYASITAALTDINTLGMSGAVTLELQAAYVSTVETFPLTFGTAIPCLNATNTLTIRPEAGVSTPLTITSAAAQTVFINGADYVTFDGRPGGAGTSQMLVVSNTSATGVAFAIANDATYNTITYCDVQGQNTTFAATAAIQAGVIFFGAANATSLMGNDNNSITYCNIHGVGNGTTNVPANCIAGFGTSSTVASYNDLGNISNNNIYDFYNTAGANGIRLDVGHTAWTINNNSFYLTAVAPITYAGTGTHCALWIRPSTTSIANAANNFTITNNFIGGNSANATGTLSITAPTGYMFWGMDISLGMGTASTVSNNTIRNITMVTTSTASNAFTGINLNQGNINCTNNLIGSTTVNGNISLTTGAAGGFHGIRSTNAAAGTYTISNNTLSGINVTAPLVTNHNISYVITASGGLSNTISNNIIGGTLNNSINFINASTSTTASVLKAILANGGSANTITNNTVSNLNMNYSSTGAQATTLCGIEVSSGAGVVTGNTITKLYSNTQTTNAGTTPPIIGILYNSTALTANVSNNTIHTLGLLNTASTAGNNITGIYFNGSANANVIEKNTIHSLYTTSAVATGGNITGMDIAAGTVTVKNNMIRLGYDDQGASVVAPMTIRGVTKNTSIVNFWFNSIFIGGTGVGTATANSLAFNRNNAGATLDDIRNNIFMNSRSNATTGGKHYAMYLGSNTLLTLNYNDYFANGTGNVLGFNGAADVATFSAGWSGISSHDLNSYSEDPQYINPTGTATTGDLHIHATTPTIVEQTGTPFFTVPDDIDGQTRNTLTPTDMGADAGNFVSRLCTGTPTAGNAVSANSNICTGNNTSVSLTGYSNQPGISLLWMESATAGGPYVAAAGQNTTATYSSPTLTANTYYVCQVTCNPGGTTLGSPVTSTEAGITVNNPIVTPASPAPERCGPGTVSLVASTIPGATMYWFDPSNVLIGSGSPVTSPNLTATTNFTVKSVIPAGPGIATVGTGATVNTTTSYPTPYGNFWGSVHEQYLIRASELAALGFVAGNISSLAFNLQASLINAHSNFTLKIAGTTANAMTTSLITTGFTTVYGGTGTTIAAGTAPGWQTYPFTTPFFWDGSSNIVVDATFVNCSVCNTTATCTTSWGNNGVVFNSTTPYVSTVHFQADNNCTIATMAPSVAGTTYSSRPNMRLNGVLGCTSPTQTVTATVIAPPTLTVTNSQRVCNNAVATLAVTSTVGDYDGYTWAPVTNLYTDAACTIAYTAGTNTDTVFYKTATTGAEIITCSSANSVSPFCSNTATTTITTQPASVTVTALPSSVCVSGSTVITLVGTTVGLQWQDSTAGTWNNIVGAVTGTYTTPVLSGTPPSTNFYYRARIMPTMGADCYVSPMTISVNIPSVSNPRDTARCGVGSATLVASGTPGSTLKWYAALTGGASIGTGSPFNTPVISTTTPYYVSATIGASLTTTTVGTGTVVNTATSYPSPYGQFYGSDHEQYLITAAELYALGLSGGNITSLAFNLSTGYAAAPLQNFQIRMANTSATAMTTALITAGITTVYGGVGTTYTPPNATGWAPISLTTPFFWDGSSNLVVDVAFSNCSVCNGTATCTTSFTTNGIVTQTTTPFVSTVYIRADGNCTVNSMTPSVNGIVASQRPNMQFVIEQGCASTPRTTVTASVTPSPGLTITPNQIVCNNEITALSVTTPIGAFDTYVWSPAADLYTDAAATIPYVAGANVPTGTVYFKSATAGVKPLVCTSSNTLAPFCANVAYDTVRVQPATATLTANPVEICISGTSVLTLASATSNLGIQWQDSLAGGAWTNIAAATAATYTTTTLTADAYYRAQIKNSLGAVCLAKTDTIVVNNPLVTDTLNVTRCGAGTVTLEATPSTGATINWYTALTGGAPIATGNTFTTPVISANTTYYVSASKGGNSNVPMGGIGAAWNSFATAGGFQSTAITGASQVCTILQPLVISQMDMYPSAAIGTSFTVQIRSGAATGPVVGTYTGTTTVQNTGTPTVAQTIPVNFNITTPGTYYVGFLTNPATWRTNVALPYPLTLPGLISITGSSLGVGFWYYLYNWKITTGCEQPTRTPVTATVSPAPVLTISPTTATVCAGTPIAVTVSSPTPTTQYDTYVWSAGANETGSAAAGYTLAPTSGGTYTLTATQTTGLLCGAIATVTATVNPVPVVSTATATPTPVCEGAVVNLASTGSGVSSTTYDMISIPYGPQTGGTTPLAGPTGDDASTSTPLGFDFNFWGVNYTNPTITMYTNGFIQIGTSSGSTTVYGQTLPNAANPNNIVAGLFEDLNVVAGTGTVTSFTTGTAPNRVFNVKYNNVQYYVANGNISFQIQLFERTNVVEVHVLENNDGGFAQTPTLGIENAAGTSAVTAYNSTYSPTSGTPEAWRFTPTVTSYAWAGPGGYTSTSQNPAIPNIALTGAGVYTVTFTNAANCTASGNVPVTVTPSPSSVVSGTASVCSGAAGPVVSVALTGTAPWALTYTNGTTPVSVTGINTSPYTFTASSTTAGTYTVTTLSDVSCIATPPNKTGSAAITINPLPTGVIASASSTTLCLPGTVDLFGAGTASSGSTNYDWDSSPSGYTSSTQNPTGVAPTGNTTYILTVTDAVTTCSASANVAVNVGTTPGTSTLNVNTPIHPGCNNQMDLNVGGGVTGFYAWHTTNTPTALNQVGTGSTLTATPGAAGLHTYYVFETDATGLCYGSSAMAPFTTVGAYPTNLPTTTGTVTANGVCLDGQGWSHFYNDAVVGNEVLLLSIDETNHYMGIMGTDYTVSADVYAGYGSGTALHICSGNAPGCTGTSYPSSNDWYVMNRDWNVNIINAAAQVPAGQTLPIRSYFTQTDFNDVQGTLLDSVGGSPIAVSNMYFYKISGNPTNNQTGVTPAQVVIYSNAATPTVNNAYLFALANNGTPPIYSNSNGWGWQLNNYAANTSGVAQFYAKMNVPSFSSGGGGGSPVIPMPVDGLELKGVHSEGVNTLTWSTQLEQNNSHFELLRGQKKDIMSKIATVQSKAPNGTSSLPLDYEYVDANPSAKTLYYVLRQVDIDGRTEMSNTVEITMNDDYFIALDAYPNPTSKMLNVNLNAPVNSRLAIEIHDLLGKVVYQQTYTSVGGTEVLSLDVSKLATGSYTLQIRSKTTDFSAISRFVKINE